MEKRNNGDRSYGEGQMNGPDTAPPVAMSASDQGDTQPLGTVVESIPVSLNTYLEVAIRYND